ncbi:hypothetical protein JCM10207_002918 [Rhodosporidiobolus poonsookiae]
MSDADYASIPHPEVVLPVVPNAPFFQPASTPSVGTALPAKDWPQNKDLPLLFQPITVGKTAKMEFKNRIFVAPMCQYSCAQDGEDIGALTPWHLVHLGAWAVRGAAVVMVEATSVMPNGRLSPNDSGLWNDRQRDALKPVFDFIKAQGAKAAIQLGHGGRKTSTLAPWLDSSTINPPLKSHVATNGAAGGWTDNVMAPSAIPYEEGTYPQPREMTEKDFAELKQAWIDAVRRADEAGADVIEIHSAHGYHMHNFLSPLSNQRKDKYGGSLENRMRFPLEVVAAVRAQWPASKPLFLRFSATDWYPAGEKNEKGEWISWGIEQSKIYAKQLVKLGVDLIDVSSGGNTPEQKITVGPGYQVPFAEEIRKSLADDPEVDTIPISTVGLITNGTQAEEVLQQGKADVISVAREFLRDAETVFNWAQELGVVVNVPVQYQRAWTRMMTKKEEK